MSMSGTFGTRLHRGDGFSLLEMIVAVAIMTIVVGVAVPAVTVAVDRAKKKETRSEMSAIAKAVESYFSDTWELPRKLRDLEVEPRGVSGWAGPYIYPPMSGSANVEPDVSKDAWNRAYLVEQEGDSVLVVASGGPDRRLGSADDIKMRIDVTPIRRAHTLEELSLINMAVKAYNAKYLPSEPLPNDWSAARGVLEARGYLPQGADYLARDGWGDPYVPDPPGGKPVVRFRSRRVGAGH